MLNFGGVLYLHLPPLSTTQFCRFIYRPAPVECLGFTILDGRRQQEPVFPVLRRLQMVRFSATRIFWKLLELHVVDVEKLFFCPETPKKKQHSPGYRTISWSWKIQTASVCVSQMLNIWPIYLLYMYHQFHYPRFVGFIWPAPHFECLGYTGICVNLFCQKSASNYEETSIPPGESKTSGMENSGPPTRYDLIPLRYGLRTSKSRGMSILPGRCQLSRGWLGGWEEMVVTPLPPGRQLQHMLGFGG